LVYAQQIPDIYGIKKRSFIGIKSFDDFERGSKCLKLGFFNRKI